MARNGLTRCEELLIEDTLNKAALSAGGPF
jgi:hypothetical protein